MFKKNMLLKIVVVVFFIRLGCLNSCLKKLRREVAQVRQFGVYLGNFDPQNYIVSNLIVQY